MPRTELVICEDSRPPEYIPLIVRGRCSAQSHRDLFSFCPGGTHPQCLFRWKTRPDDGFADASDPATVLLGNFNRIYGVPGNADTKRTYHGNYGFILD